MKKIILLLVLTLSLGTLYSTGLNSKIDNSKFLLETQIGYSKNILKMDFILKDSIKDQYHININSEQVSIAEKLTIKTNSFINYTILIAYNFTLKSDLLFKKVSGENIKTNTINISREDTMDSIDLFLGIEKPIQITNNINANISIGPNFIYNIKSIPKNSYYSFGLESIANINYNFLSNMKINLGIRAYYNPFCVGDSINAMKEDVDLTQFNYSNYVYSIIPTIGFIYSI